MLVLAASYVRFYRNPFFVVFLMTKMIKTKRTHFAARINLDKKLKDQSGALHSIFMLFYTVKAQTGSLVLGEFFFSFHIQNQGDS